jgi:bacterioferritin
MATEKLLGMLNDAIARELQVTIQYMWQHVMWSGVKGFAVKDSFKEIAIDEMKHAEMIAERLNYLGGVPTTKPTTINVGNDLKAMLEQDKLDEEKAITMYKDIMDAAQAEKDYTTREIFEHILKDEEEHHDHFSTLLEGV